MDLLVLDTNFNSVAVIDEYESFIWTDRYNEYGDFELYTSMRDGILDYIKQDYYLVSRDSEHVMIIEKILIESDVEEGNHITVSGRSLESILDRRIIWGMTAYKGDLQNGVKALLEAAIISPTDPNRKIDNFIFEASDDEDILSYDMDAQYTGDNLYDVIVDICKTPGIGFKITLNEANQFVFKLYNGTDRSYAQTKVPYVVFSPNFDNIINANYVESKAALKNVTLVGGEGEGVYRRYASVGNESGLARRELFTDARDISSHVDSETTLSDEEYLAQLAQRGAGKLAEKINAQSFEGEVDATTMFKHNEDFYIGDIVQVADEYGHESVARVTEVVISQDDSGMSIYPTFETI